jgi:hypothetical protein
VNIFVTSRSPLKAAMALDDKRVIKMVLESVQLLSNACGGPYKPTHTGHPCSKWVQANPKHYAWLWHHAVALGQVYTDCVTPGRVHRCLTPEVFDHLKVPDFDADEVLAIRFQNSARRTDQGLDFTHLPPVKAYRGYLNVRWQGDKRVPVWSNRDEPRWKHP